MEKKYSLRFTLTLMFIASALTCLVLLIIIGRGFGVLRGRFTELYEYAALLNKIDELYIGEYDSAELNNAAKYAAVDSLGDSWSYYMSPEEYSEYLNYTNNSYVGIGVGIVTDEDTGGLLVTYVYKNSAAETAGIAAGDIIIGVDGVDITTLPLEETQALLAREIGDTAELSLLREGGVTESVTVEYAYIFTDPVSYEMLDNSIGYIELLDFDNGAADSFIEAIDKLVEQGATGLIFDVRGNGGGRVSELTQILDYLLPEGEIFVAVDKSGKERTTSSDESMIDIPAVVLVDRYSFSAAEYFAAILSEYGRAQIVGEQTSGKNRSQVTVELPGGGALHISSGQYLTKNRVSLYDEGGLTPDFSVALTEDEFARLYSGNLAKKDDSQLQKALLFLKEK